MAIQVTAQAPDSVLAMGLHMGLATGLPMVRAMDLHTVVVWDMAITEWVVWDHMECRVLDPMVEDTIDTLPIHAMV